eukprot:jgi/Hompol1/6838/HPOL_003547-RA
MAESADQSILVCGEHSSGKTTAFRTITRHLADLGSTSSQKRTRVAARLSHVDTIFRAFGESTVYTAPHFYTTSSLIRYDELQFDKDGKFVGAKFIPYLLDHTRITAYSQPVSTVATAPGIFNVFFWLVEGATLTERSQWQLDQPFAYLPDLSKIPPTLLDTFTEDLQQLRKSFKILAIGSRQQTQIFQLLAAILHLGNITFTPPDKPMHAAQIVPSSSFSLAASLLGLSDLSLEQLLTTRLVKDTAPHTRDNISLLLDVGQSEAQRDSLGQCLYAVIFSWIVEQLNVIMCKDELEWETFIGVLDIPGMSPAKQHNFDASSFNRIKTAEGSILTSSYPPLQGFHQFFMDYANERAMDFARRYFVGLATRHIESMGENPRHELKEFLSRSSVIETYSATNGGVITILNFETTRGNSTTNDIAVVNRSVGRNDERVCQLTVGSVDGGADGNVGETTAFAIMNGNECVGLYDAHKWTLHNSPLIQPSFVMAIRGTIDDHGTENMFIRSLFSNKTVAMTVNEEDDSSVVSAYYLTRAPSSVRRKSRGSTVLSSSLNRTASRFDVELTVGHDFVTGFAELMDIIADTKPWFVFTVKPSSDPVLSDIVDESYIALQATRLSIPKIAGTRAVQFSRIMPLKDAFERYKMVFSRQGITINREPRVAFIKLIAANRWTSTDADCTLVDLWLSEAAWRHLESQLIQIEATNAERGHATGAYNSNRLSRNLSHVQPSQLGKYSITASEAGAANAGHEDEDGDEDDTTSDAESHYDSEFGDDLKYAPTSKLPAVLPKTPIPSPSAATQPRSLSPNRSATVPVTLSKSSLLVKSLSRSAGLSPTSKKPIKPLVSLKEPSPVIPPPESPFEPNKSTKRFADWKNISNKSRIAASSASKLDQPPPPTSSKLPVAAASLKSSRSGAYSASEPSDHASELDKHAVSVPIDNKPRPKKTSPRRLWWMAAVWSLTWYIPPFILGICMRQSSRQIAWREKLALCILIAAMNFAILFLIVGLGWVLCPKTNVLSPGEISSTNDLGGNAAIYMYGSYYFIRDIALSHLSQSRPTSQTEYWRFSVLGQDVSPMFSKESFWNTYCPTFAKPAQPFELFPQGFFGVKDARWFLHNRVNTSMDFLQLPAIKNARRGTVVWDMDTIQQRLLSDPTYGRAMLAYDRVYDLQAFFAPQYAAVGDNFFGPDMSKIITSTATLKGYDLTWAMESLRANNTQTWKNIMTCLDGVFYVGDMDHRRDLKCVAPNYVLLAAACAIGLIMLVKFIAALQFSPIPTPDSLEKFVICFVPCYTEDAVSIRRTFESIVSVSYPNKRRLLFVVADGMIMGSGNDRPTPRIVLDVLGVGADVLPDSVMFESVGEKSKQFIAALQFSPIPTPDSLEKFVICFVPCYTEDAVSIRRTFESIVSVSYPNKRRLLFVVADGMIMGSGNDRPTPRIVLDVLGVGADVLPDSVMFESVGEKSKQVNYAKVYSGMYVSQGQQMPFVVVVKTGKLSEYQRPGNRGKRDSQMILLRFLSRVHHVEAMNPLELEIHRNMSHVLGVDPYLYEFVLMVDADTRVHHDSIRQLVASMTRDSRVIGVCGETRILNDRDTWVTILQIYEYFISHHLSKAFESLFGSVTCLPGCFSLYRIRSPTTNKPLLIDKQLLKDYGQNNAETLHSRNLLHLGEDRYLTTLLMKHFPRMRTTFTSTALCHTIAPDRWQIFQSQRRRWINSTVHNLIELLRIPNLCGTCCFSLRFFIFIDLIATVIQPAAIVYLVYLVVISVMDHSSAFPVISLAMIAAIYGLQIFLFLLKNEVDYLGWMIVYVLAIPIFSFYLPLYAFWSFDDFSWGNTRETFTPDGKQSKIEEDDELMDASSIPLTTWRDYEAVTLKGSSSDENDKSRWSGDFSAIGMVSPILGNATLIPPATGAATGTPYIPSFLPMVDIGTSAGAGGSLLFDALEMQMITGRSMGLNTAQSQLVSQSPPTSPTTLTTTSSGSSGSDTRISYESQMPLAGPLGSQQNGSSATLSSRGSSGDSSSKSETSGSSGKTGSSKDKSKSKGKGKSGKSSKTKSAGVSDSPQSQDPSHNSADPSAASSSLLSGLALPSGSEANSIPVSTKQDQDRQSKETGPAASISSTSSDSLTDQIRIEALARDYLSTAELTTVTKRQVREHIESVLQYQLSNSQRRRLGDLILDILSESN